MKLIHQRLLGLLFMVIASTAAVNAAPKVGVLLKGRTGFWAEAEKGAKEAGEKYGLDLLVKIPPTENSVAAQLQMLNALAAQDIQALVIAPDDQNVLQAPVAELAKKGVKIIVLDSPLAGDAGAVFVGTDQSAAGAAAGRLIASNVRSGDEVVFFKASETLSGGATESREKGALAALRENTSGVLVRGDFFAGSDPEIALGRARLLLEKYPAAKMAFASSTTGTMSILHALEQKHLVGSIKLIGFGYNLNQDVAEALAQGRLLGWIAQLPRNAGFMAVEAAATLLKGGRVPPVLHTDFIVITKENLKEDRVQALLLP